MSKNKKSNALVFVVIILVAAVGTVAVLTSFAATEEPQTQIGNIESVSNSASEKVQESIQSVANELEAEANTQAGSDNQ